MTAAPKFNLNDYETVKSRKKRFKADNPDGRIIVAIESVSNEHAVVKATIYKTADDQAKGLPLSTGYAQEIKGVGSFANKLSFLENCEESAIGRALDNAGYAGNDKASREEMQKVNRSVDSETNKTPRVVKAEPAAEGLAGYVVGFGKYKGKQLGDIDLGELQGYVNYIEDKARKDNKQIQGQVLELIQAVRGLAEETGFGNIKF